MIAYNFGAGAAGSPVPDWERLGRGVFSGRRARRYRPGGKVHQSHFREADGITTLSADRLSIAPVDIVVENGERVAAGRPESSGFYGWASIDVEHAATGGCRAIVSPLLDGSNPYHADIVLPMSAAAVPGEQDSLALRLAARAVWVEKPVDEPGNGGGAMDA